jgi:chorismate synthase
MNSFGRLFQLCIYGESHGTDVGIVIDGCPAGLPLREEDFQDDLKRRNPAVPGTTARKEEDRPQITSGVYLGKTTGFPLHISFVNRDLQSDVYARIKDTPRPGHADFVAHRKFGGFADIRGGGHFSGRLTVALVAAGVIAKKLIHPVRVQARLLEVGGCQDVEAAVSQALDTGDSIGGLVECVAQNMPVGLGEPFFDALESRLSHLLFSIPAIRGVEFGAGFQSARMTGREHNDDILSLEGKTESNHSGGINGGISNGNPLVFRAAVKPTSSISLPQKTVNLKTGDPVELQVSGRHDTCIALRTPVIFEAVTAIVLTDMMLLEQLIPRNWKS